MPGYEEYRKIQHSEFTQEQKQDLTDSYFARKGLNKTLRAPAPGENEGYTFDYDADQLMEYFENRNKDAEDNAFQTRTDYYFKNVENTSAKMAGFANLAREDNPDLALYSARYRNHRASKRRSGAREASALYNEMNRRMQLYRGDDELGSNLNSYQKYLHKEEIMMLRIKAMQQSAKVKSKSDAHEDYLKGRAKMSCYMILKDQLTHYIEGEQDARIRNKLSSKLSKVEKNIKSAYETVKKYAPKVHDEWRKKNRINDATYGKNAGKYKQESPLFSEDSTKLLTNLEKIQDASGEAEWPTQVVLKDFNGAEINKAEATRNEWNEKYNEAKAQGNEAALLQLNKEALNRFVNMKLPTPKMLRNTYKYVMDNLRDYYELTKKALPYYRAELQKKGYVREYAGNHPEFRQRLDYLEAVDRYVNFALRADYHIHYDAKKSAKPGKIQKGRFHIESDPKYRFYRDKKTGNVKRDNAYGFRQEDAMFKMLEDAFRSMGQAPDNLLNRTLINGDDNLNNIINVNLQGQQDDNYSHLGDWPGDQDQEKIIIDNIENDKENDLIIDTSKKKENRIIEEPKKENKIIEEPEKENKIIEEPEEENKIIEEPEVKNKVNDDVMTLENFPTSTEDAIAKVEEQFSDVKLSKADKKELLDTAKNSYEYALGIKYCIPASVYRKVKDQAKGIDIRGLVSFMRPVKVDKYGYPLNAEEKEKQRLNIEDCNNLCANSMAKRKDFLDRIANEAMKVVFTVDELNDTAFILKNKQRAIHHLNLIHNIINLYNDHAEYYQKDADPKIRRFMFALVSATDYINLSAFKIQQALFSKGLDRSFTGASSSGYGAVIYRKGVVSYEDVIADNKRLAKTAPGTAMEYATNFNSATKKKMDPYDEEEEMVLAIVRKKLGTQKARLSDLGIGGKVLYKGEYGDSPKEIDYGQEVKIIRKYLGIFKKGKTDKKIFDKLDECIDSYRKEPYASTGNQKDLINDLKAK
ncbi:MAG: hypothetical protein E7307_04855 [Butyrivibrio sp.]|nr:hypothetical protein [Butyrivibrio sp.]